MLQLIEESRVSLAYRDELYRTARDVSMQATQPENTREIDKYVLSLAARGKVETFHALTSPSTSKSLCFSGDMETLKHLLMEGYDHIIDIGDEESIMQIAAMRGHSGIANFLEGIPDFETSREKLHRFIRNGDLNQVKEYVEMDQRLVFAKNYFGRCSLHIAVLNEKEEIVEYLARSFRSLLFVGDNVSHD